MIHIQEIQEVVDKEDSDQHKKDPEEDVVVDQLQDQITLVMFKSQVQFIHNHQKFNRILLDIGNQELNDNC